ncbi:gluconokinase [Poseidonocella pacifica]|uniref:gluconokinase n=1 Tax=Poseidonocella pacifica TaxID=871651 RepID=UPI000ACFE8BA|nr:gluconokinase [Poseidonocella pacifica]
MSLSETRHIVLMGVCGCGKSTVGDALARVTGLAYVDGDDLHPPANISKMRNSVPLDDADREPWLLECGRRLRAAPEGLILGCSALKRRYRDLIRSAAVQPAPAFVYLHGSKSLLQARLDGRANHFMPNALLESQLATLEIPSPVERGITVSIDQPAEAIALQIAARLALGGPSIANVAGPDPASQCT